ncbi:MAG: GNAT family N-acetyltransferase [Roseinatronobacter sp.]
MTTDDLAALHARCFTTPAPWDAATFAGFLRDPACSLTTRAPHAFVLLRRAADEVEVLTLATDPSARRQGLARHVLTEALALQNGASACFLEVAADNAPACALYAALGFEKVGRRRGYYRAPDGRRTDALVLRAALPRL